MRHPAFQSIDHRPYPLAKTPWSIAQRWSDLLFAHWPTSTTALRPFIPKFLEIDTFKNQAWIGVVPFTLRIRLRGTPVVPRVGAFPEINVRTYVTHQGKPGVWFFSLDATSPLAIWLARWQYALPYYRADIETQTQQSWIQFDSRRRTSETEAAFQGKYRPTSDPFHADAGSLDAWLTERYCLYAMKKDGGIWRTEVHHQSWPLQNAECVLDENSMTAPLGIPLQGKPKLHFSKKIEVVTWLPERIGDNVW